MTTPNAHVLAARRFQRWNLMGAYTLWRRDMLRTLKYWPVSIGAHALQALLFAAVFSVVLTGADPHLMAGRPDFVSFLLPGLVGSTILQRAFETSAFSVVFDKVEGIIRDIVAAPLSPLEALFAYTASATCSALIVGSAVWLILQLFGLGLPDHPLVLLFFSVGGAAMIGLAALIAGIWADKWDHISAVQSFAFLPFVFLSGVFFSLDQLPEKWQFFAQFNPLYYVIDGIRHGLTGQGQANLVIGVAIIISSIGVLGGVGYEILRRGYKLKS